MNQPPGSPGLANVDAGASGSVTSGINGLGSFGSATITGPNAVTITNSYNVAPTTSTLPGQGSTLLLQNTTLGNDTVINSANNLGATLTTTTTTVVPSGIVVSGGNVNITSGSTTATGVTVTYSQVTQTAILPPGGANGGLPDTTAFGGSASQKALGSVVNGVFTPFSTVAGPGLTAVTLTNPNNNLPTTYYVPASAIQTTPGTPTPNGGSLSVARALNVRGASTTTGLTNTGNIANSGSLSTGTLAVSGLSSTNGLTNAGGLSNAGGLNSDTLNVSGASTTTGITNTGRMSTSTLAVSGASTTTGITNTGALGTSTLAVSGASTTTGITNTGALATSTLAVSGASTTTGLTNTGNIANSGSLSTGTLAVAGLSSTNGLTNTGSFTTQSLNVSGVTNTNGINNNNNRISGLAAGSALNDAVNVGQLQSVRNRLNAGVAGVVAMANIPPVEPGKTFSLGIGVGSYASETGMSAGAAYRISDGWTARASVATDSRGQFSAGGGVGFSW